MADPKETTLLVLDANPENDWYKLFKGAKGVKVEQAEWGLVEVDHCDEDGGCFVTIGASAEPIPGTSQRFARERKVDFVVVRQFVVGLHGKDWLPTLSAMMFANLPAVNTLQSVFLSTDRTASIGELRKIQARLGRDRFPLVPMSFYPNASGSSVRLARGTAFPAVAKVGTSLGGYGKMRILEADDWSDFSSVLALGKEFVTVEPFVKDRVADLRIQKIGQHVRAYRRFARNWKGNVGEATVEDVAVTEEYALWAKEAEKAWGGLDILSIDAVVDSKGRHTILEMNDTCTGFGPLHLAEDFEHLRDLVLQRISQSPR